MTNLPSQMRASPHEALSRFPHSAGNNMHCEFCGGPVHAQGNRKKRFCRDLCRTRFHYARRQARDVELRRRLGEAGVAIEAAERIAVTHRETTTTPNPKTRQETACHE